MEVPRRGRLEMLAKHMSFPDRHIRTNKSQGIEMIDRGFELSLIDLAPEMFSGILDVEGWLFNYFYRRQTDDGPGQCTG